jgi:hypothetical protein
MITKKLKHNYEICRYWTTFMRQIQTSLAADYFYYKTGFLPLEKVIDVVNKFTDYYHLDLPNYERSRMHKADISTTVIHFFYSGQDEVFFILLARPGVNGKKDGLFFEREKYADARNKKNRIKFNCYEALQIQKQAIPGTPLKADLSWTWALTKTEIIRVKTEFSLVSRHGNALKIKQLCYGLRHLIGFHGVRNQYYDLRTHFEKEYIRTNKKPLRDIYYLPDKIGYVKRKNEDIQYYLNDILLKNKYAKTIDIRPTPANVPSI